MSAIDMEKQKETFLIPAIKVPKNLMKRAAEAIALNLINISLPMIQTLVYKPDPNAPKEEEDQINPQLFGRLKKLKSWYWEETAEHLGDCDSKSRIMVATSLMDILDVNEAFKDCQPLHRLSLQILFTLEAGDLGLSSVPFADAPEWHIFSRFLISVAPFYLRGLRDESIKYSESLPINLLMVNSPDLKRVHLHQNLNSSSLDRLRINCNQAEVITLDFDSDSKHTRLIIEDNLFKTFFCNNGKAIVFEHMDKGSEVPQTFTNLKEIWIRCDHIIISLTPFIQCLQYGYNKVKLTITCLASVPYDSYMEKYPFVAPTFQVSGIDAKKKSIKVYFCNESFDLDENTGPAPKRTVDASSFLCSYKEFFTNTYYMQDIMSMMQVTDLRYIIADNMKIEILPRVPRQADKIYDLYVYGPIPDINCDEKLVQYLNQCKELQILNFMVKPMPPPVLEGLNPLVNVRLLSLIFTELRPSSAVYDARYPHCMEGVLTLENIKLFMELLFKATPNLEILETPCFYVLQEILDKGLLQNVHTLSVVHGSLETVTNCIMRLPHLRAVILDKYFECDLYKDLKKTYFNFDIKIGLKKGRLVLPYIL